MSQKTCVITMQYGFVGILSVKAGMANIANCHSRSNQFLLDNQRNYSDQIFEYLTNMVKEADTYHDAQSHIEKGYGHILSHTVTIIDW